MLWNPGSLAHSCLGLLLGLSVVATWAAAPDERRAPPVVDLRAEYSIRHWTLENGLPDVAVFGVTQTTDGYLWLGTRAGVVRFDGVTFATFDRANTPELPDNGVLQVLADDCGGLWASTARGVVVRLPSGLWELVLAEGEPLIPERGEAMHAHGGAVWIAGSGRRWWRCVAGGRPEAPPGEPIRGEALAVAANGDLWWVDGGLLFRQRASDGARDRFPLAPLSAGPRTSGAFAVRPDGGLHLLLAAGDSRRATLHEVLEDGPRFLDGFALDDDAAECRLTPSADGAWWLQVQPRLTLCWRAGRGIVPALPEAQAEDVAMGFLSDREGSLWVGTRWSGLYRLRPRAGHPESQAGRVPLEGVRAVLALRDRRLAVGTDRGLVRIVQSATAPSGSTPSSGNADGREDGGLRRELSEHSIRVLAEDRLGRLWVGTQDGLYVDRGERVGFETVSLPVLEGEGDGDRRSSFKIRAILASRCGDLWVAAPRLLSVQPAGTDGFRAVAVLAREALATALAEDSRGRIWLATEGRGVAVLAVPPGGVALGGADWWAGLPHDLCVPVGDGTTRFHSPPPVWLRAGQRLSSDHAWDLWADRAGGIWVACENGLNFLQPAAPGSDILAGSTFQFTRAHGLPDHQLNSFIEDGLGNVWCGTDHGVFRVHREALLAVAGGRAERVQAIPCRALEAADPIETNGRISRPGVVRTDDGQLWFATTRGVIPFDPRLSTLRARPPLVAIEEVRADGEALYSTLPRDPRGGPVRATDARRTGPSAPAPEPAGAASAVLAPGRARVLEFRFTGLSFGDPEGVVFRYRLEGSETTWHDAGTRRVAYYTNLDPGDYRFQVLAATPSGAWAEQPAEFAFRLAPFIWQTLWFRFAVLAAVVLAATGVATWRIREVRRREALARENALLRERASIARDIHDDLGPRLTQLALLTEAAEGGLDSGSQTGQDRADSSHRRQLALLARDLANTLDGTLWTVEPTGDSLPSLVEYLIDFATDFLRPSGIRLELELADPVPAFPLSRALKRHLSLFAKEALNNVVKHAGARRAVLGVEAVPGGFALRIADDGRGLPTETAPASEIRSRPVRALGLASLRTRAEAIGGRLSVESGPARGTVVRLEVVGPTAS